jgi:CRP/FNR family transcriptional regulator
MYVETREQKAPASHRALGCAACDARALSPCAAIEGQDLERLARVAVQQNVKPDQIFIEEGAPAACFFSITAGTARLYKSLRDGRRQIIGFARAGDFLGLAGSTEYGFSAEAIDQVRLCRFTRLSLQRLLDDFPAMERRLLETAGNELVAAQQQMLLLGRKTASERLATFLVGLSRGAVPGALHLPMSRSDIADYLGLTIETVSRTFTKFKSAGLIALPAVTEVLVLDRPRLTRLSECAG